MRNLIRNLILVVGLLGTCCASEQRVRVTDPSSAVIAGARVTLYGSDARPISVNTTGSDGTVDLRNVPARAQLRVEVSGFRPYEQNLPTKSESVLEVRLQLASAAETIVVTADATPVEAEKAGAAVSSLDSDTLKVLNLPELSDNLRFVPGAYVSDSGQRGGLSSMFVRGGESTYNKVIVDGVTVNEDSGTSGSFNFGVIPTFQIDRVEMARGAASTLYGSDAMTSVTQLWSGSGSTRVPELKFGSEGGTFSSARGYASLAGARSGFDYNLFGDQFQTEGQGVNDTYENASQGANLGVRFSGTSALRLRLRHSNSRTGVPGDWYPELGVPPNPSAYGRQNDFLGSLALTFAPVRNWQNTLTGFEYNHILRNANLDFASLTGRPGDSLYDSRDHFNRAGFDYLGEVTERVWTRSVFGFRFENENAYLSDSVYTTFNHGIRRNTALYGEQVIDWKRLAITGGLRWEHNENFGNKAVPRAAASFLVLHGGSIFSGTRLRASIAEGIKAPAFEQNLGIAAYETLPNPGLKPEQVQAVEAGLMQGFMANRWSVSALYFHNRFTNQIEWDSLLPSAPACAAAGFSYCMQYVNAEHATAQGAELELQGRLTRRLSVGGSYTYTSIVAQDPSALLRRPKHFGTALVAYSGTHWGASLAGSFIGRRTDYDYQVDYYSGQSAIPLTDAGYARLDASAYCDITHRLTAYATVQNLLNHKYEEVAGYPAYKATFRAGMRVRLGGA